MTRLLNRHNGFYSPLIPLFIIMDLNSSKINSYLNYGCQISPVINLYAKISDLARLYECDVQVSHFLQLIDLSTSNLSVSHKDAFILMNILQE